MIEKMTRYDFILLSGNKDDFLERLSALGLMDITHSPKPVDAHSEELLSRIESVKTEIRRIELGKDAHLAELEEECNQLRKQSDAVRIWGDYNKEKLASTGLPVWFYSVSDKVFDPSWTEQYALFEIARERGKVWFVVLGNCDIPATPLPVPTHTIAELEALYQKKEAELNDYKNELEGLKTTLPGLLEQVSSLGKELNLYLAGASGESAADDTLLVYTGFAPASEKERLTSELDAMDCLCFSAEANVEDNPPIKLKNNKFVKQFEILTDMYGRPDYNEFDPTPYISVFFLLFFAMCMGDAGYGLLLIAGGILLRKVDSFKNLAPLVTILGVGTFFTGIVMHTFFGVDISALPWVPSWLKAVMITGTIAGFEAQMVLSLAIGIVHLCLAMVVKTVYATKNKGFLGSLGVWGWTLLIVGGVALAVVAMLNLLPSNVLKWVFITLGVVSALGIFLFNDIKRNPLKNIGSGLWETYNTVTGLLGDVLSYLRLYALGLAGGMLGKAFNDIASMTLGDGSFGIGWLFFVIILVVGHALNLAMCCLGAFVHPLRLNFLEFFKNSGYDGKGRTYQPLSK
ncbi:MAG: ATPase V [Bacteroidales bacterium]|nr:ATPase V [Bacteroidales bacterium]